MTDLGLSCYSPRACDASLVRAVRSVAAGTLTMMLSALPQVIS